MNRGSGKFTGQEASKGESQNSEEVGDEDFYEEYETEASRSEMVITMMD